MKPINHHQMQHPFRTSRETTPNSPPLSVKCRKGSGGKRWERKRRTPEAYNTHSSVTNMTRLLRGDPTEAKPAGLSLAPSLRVQAGTSLCSTKARKRAGVSKGYSPWVKIPPILNTSTSRLAQDAVPHQSRDARAFFPKKKHKRMMTHQEISKGET